MNTQLIQDIILSVLEANDGCTLDNSQDREQREQVAQKAAEALTLASLEQLAALMGTNLSYDCEGQALLFTGVYDADKADEIAQSDLQASARRERFDALEARRRELSSERDELAAIYDCSFASDDVNPTEVP